MVNMRDSGEKNPQIQAVRIENTKKEFGVYSYRGEGCSCVGEGGRVLSISVRQWMVV